MNSSPVQETLLRHRAEGLAILQRNSYIAKYMVFSNFILGPIIYLVQLCYYLSQANKPEAVARAFALALTTVVFILFLRQWHEFNKSPDENSMLLTAPENIVALIKQLISDMASKMGIGVNSLSIYINRRAYSGGPSIVEQKNRVILVVPLGFLKILNSKPELAQAMLEHEISHVNQKDSQLWSLATVFWNVMTKVMLPIMVIFFALYILFVTYMFSKMSKIYEPISDKIDIQVKDALRKNEQQYRQEIEKVKNAVYPNDAKENKSIQDSSILLLKSARDLNETLIKSAGDTEKSKIGSPIEDAKFRLALAGVQTLIVILWMLLVFGSIRWLRRLSEEMADLAVVLHSDGLALKQALEDYGGGSGQRFFAVHPPTKLRLIKITRWIQALQGAPHFIRKNPVLAAALSFILPGAGQVYNRQVGKGVLVGLLTIVLYIAIVGFFMHIWLIVDAYTNAKKLDNELC